MATTPIAVALVAGAVVARYPEPAAAVFWLVVDLVLLAVAARGYRWALALLTLTTAFGAVVFLMTGVSHIWAEPQYLIRGLADAAAATLLIKAWRVKPAAATA